MSNSLAKAALVAFEEFVEGFDAACVLSKEVQTRFPDPTDVQRSPGKTEWLSQDHGAVLQSGLDISGGSDDPVIERKIPLTYRSPDNVRYSLNADEANDPV